MKQKIITGLILIAIFLPALYLGGNLFRLTVLVMLLLGALEIANIFKSKWPSWMNILVIIMVYGLSFLQARYFLVGISVVIFTIFLLTVYFEWFDVSDATFLFTLLLIVGLAVKGINAAFAYGSLAILYIAVSTYLTDTGAYFVGLTMGKHKLAPRISPKKTIEGAIGGWIIGSIGSYIYATTVIAGRFDLDLLIVASLLMPPMGQLGDLAFSSIKRHFNIKDFGHLFPAHGGVLDRIDSLLFNFMFFYALLSII